MKKILFFILLAAMAVGTGFGLQACGKISGLGVGGKLIVSGAGS